MYTDSHPWICFSITLRHAHPLFWMLMGEAQSKCEHIETVPLPYRISERLCELYLAKGVLATTAIEGNTLTQEQVIDQMQGNLSLPPSKEYLRKEIQNILDGCSEIAASLKSDELLPLSADLICHFNALVLKDLSLQDEVRPGVIRTHRVAVGRYEGAPSEDCRQLLENLCDWLNQLKEGYTTASQALLKAMLAHLYIAWIHPFGDGNGRTARLVEYYILASAGFPAPVAHLLSNHYNETRNIYYQKLDEARFDKGCPMSFLQYALEGFVDGLKTQLQLIRDFQWDQAWEQHVKELFHERGRPSDQRRLHLLLILAKSKRWIPVSLIPKLSPGLTAAYATVSGKTLTRDLDSLEELGLVEQEKSRVRARRESVLRFLPWRRTADLLSPYMMPLLESRILLNEFDETF